MLQIIFDNLAEGVIVFDGKGRQCRHNAMAAAMHGFSSPEEYQEKLPLDIFELYSPEGHLIPPDQWPQNRVLRGENLSNWEGVLRRRDQDKWQRVFKYSGNLVMGMDGRSPLAILTIRDNTERDRTEKKIRLHNRVLQGIKDIFEAGIVSETDSDLAGKTLEITMRVTGSRLGVIGEIGSDGLLHEIAVRDTGQAACTIPLPAGNRQILKNLPLAGLCAYVLSEKKALHTNNPGLQQTVAAGLTGMGYPPLSSFLGVPLTHNNKIIGILALGNRPEGYGDEEQQSAEVLAPTFLQILYKNRTQRELRQSEARQRRQAEELNQLLQLTPFPMWIAHDPECRVITGNLAATTMLGVAQEENVSQTPGPGMKPPEVKHFRNGRRLSPEELPLQYAVLSNTPVRDTELEMVLPDGQVRNMLGGAVPLLDEAGRVRGGIAVYMDITLRKQMDARVEQAKLEWERTFDSVPDLIGILDNNFRFRRVNRALAAQIGKKPHQCINRFCFELLDNTAHPPGWCPVLKSMREGIPQNVVREFPMLDGTYLVSATPLFTEAGELSGTIFMARDITLLKMTENRLRESENRLKRAQQIACLGSWEYDKTANTLIWSDELYRILGLQPQECAPYYRKFLRLVHPEDRQILEQAYIESLRRKLNIFEIEHRIVLPETGEIRYIHEKCEHVRDADGHILRSEGMMHDITEHRETEEHIRSLNSDLQLYVRKLALANQELERSNQDLQQFAYIASHDLQEPLRTVSSFVQLLSRRYKGQLDEKADSYINYAVEGTGYMHRLLQSLLDFSRAGGGELRLEPVNLQEMVEKITRNLQWKLDESGGQVICRDLPVITADETQLFQVLQNLIINGLKFHGEEPPRVHIWSEFQERELVICVKDNGIGIDPQYSDRIFLIFQRLHRAEEYEGTGIGLAVCKRIIERHGGSIWVESTPGRGSLFCFTLPHV